jgi:iron only hydrogenase large subunit-like protein
MGVKYVMDCTVGENISLIQTAMEFVEKKQKSLKEAKSMTMLCGACPGWICYAEKTHGELLPLISTTKSAQQVIGHWIKTQFAQSIHIPANDLYHVSIMPCFDKKLEAARDDTLIEGAQLREVDCVLASLEITQFITEQNIDFESLPESPFNANYHNIDELGQLCGMSGGTSGGYLEFVFRFAAKKIWNIDVDTMQYTSIRNDFSEVTLEQNGKTLLKFARANGFRSIQNIVRRIKQNKCEYDYIEIMACPGGCTCGGGQVRADTVNSFEAKKIISLVNDTYNQRIMKSPTDIPESETMHQLLSIDPRMLQASYKPVPKKDPLSIKW